MKRLTVFLSLCVVGMYPIFGQDTKPSLNYPAGSLSYVFGENVNLRANPNTTAEIVTQLSVGDKLVVLGQSSHLLTLNGRTEHWYRVSSLSLQKEGYVWGGLLSCASAEGRNALFLMNEVKVPNTERMTIEVRAVRNNKILHTLNIPGFPYGQHALGQFNLSASIKDSVGLPDFQFIACFSSSLETGMCDVIGSTTLLQLLWNGKTMTPLPLIVLPSEENDGFGTYGGYYIFPADPQGKPGLVLQRFVEGDYDDEGIEYTQTIRVRKLRWDGKQFVLPEKK